MAKFEKGMPRLPNAGRKAGIPNKKTDLVKDILERALGKSLPESIIDDLKTCKSEVRAKVKLELMEYSYPKKRSIEVSGEIETSTNTSQLDELKSELVKHIKQN